MSDSQRKLKLAWQRHERRWEGNLYVYPVVSRRSGGLSVGINLNPDKGCNFDCIYCQVDRTVPPVVRKVDLARVAAELDAILKAARDGSLYEVPPCDVLPPEQRAVRDIAFSGDGEPTTHPRFREAVELAAGARRRFGLDQAKLVLITDAAYLSKPSIREALAVMDANNGEIWAKLDAGTEEYFRRVNRPNVPLASCSGGDPRRGAGTADRHPDAVLQAERRAAGRCGDRGLRAAYHEPSRCGRPPRRDSAPHHRTQAE